MKKTTIYWALFAVVSIIAFDFEDTNAEESTSPRSLLFADKPLVDAISEINQEFDYHVTLSQRCGNPKISGDFRGIPVEEVVNKLVRRDSAVILFDEKNKQIEINCVNENPDAVADIAASTGKRILKESPDSEIDMLEEAERINPTSFKEITNGEPTRVKEIIDPMTGLTIGEMEKKMNVQIK